MGGETPLYEHYEDHIGETVDDLNGNVISTGPVGISIADDRMQLTVHDIDMVVKPESLVLWARENNQGRKYDRRSLIKPTRDIISFVAGTWVLFQIIRDCEIDRNGWEWAPVDIQQENRDWSSDTRSHRIRGRAVDDIYVRMNRSTVSNGNYD